MGFFGHKKEEQSISQIERDDSSSADASDIEKSEDVKPQRRMLTFLFNNKISPVPSEHERIAYPMYKANIISRTFFWWLMPLMVTGYKRTIQPNDLYYLEGDLKIEVMTAKFYYFFNKRLNKAKEAYLTSKGIKVTEKTMAELDTRMNPEFEDFQFPKNIVALSLFETFKFPYLWSLVLKSVGDIATSFNPLLSKALITFVEEKALDKNLPVGKGIGYAIGCAFIVWIRGIFLTHFFHDASLVGAQVKAVLTKVLLDKSFKLNSKSKHDYSAGTITSLMGADLARIDLSLGYQLFIITFPVPVIISIGLLILNIGPSSLAGMAVFILVTIGITFSTKKLLTFRKKANVFTDGRVNLVKELLNNLKIIKYYSWESSYQENITYTRTKEMNLVFQMQVLRNFVTAFAVSLPGISSMVAFVVMYASEGLKSNAKVFTSLTLFSVLSQQIMILPLALSSAADGLIGLERVRNFLQTGEIGQNFDDSSDSDEEKTIGESDLALKVNHASFEWETFQDEEEVLPVSHLKSEVSIEATAFPGLQNIDLKVKKGEFIIITGLIGSGKSSLLSALSGFMKRNSGSVDVQGSLLLCGYPWVQNATVQDNILFGCQYNDKKYREVIYGCALESDLDILPAGDRTEIGERGITLSGGQKARINLARAVYANKDIILLDDVLSAVDARVGKHIMDNCLTGLLKDKTRILATHQLSLIGSADRVIFLNGDGSIDVGTVDELKSRNVGFNSLMEFNTEAKDDEDDEDEEEEEVKLIKKQTTNKEDFTKRKGDGKLTVAEQKGENQIKLSVYARYIKLGSGLFSVFAVPLFLLLVILSTFCTLFTNVWLSFWTSQKFPGMSDRFYIGLYVMFTILTVIFTVIEFCLLVYITNRSSRKLNIMSLNKILHAPMAFLDVTPMGQVLNRFTKDTDVLDNEMAEQARLFIYSFSMICGILILCIIYLPWFAIACPFLVLLYMAVSNFYAASAREIKRIEGVQRSFVYNNFNETLNGMDTIKAYKASNMFLKKNDKFLDRMNEAYFVSIANQRWLAINLHCVGSIFVLIISLLCACRVFTISSAGVGLLTSYVLQIAGSLAILIKSLTQVENQMTSVERLCHYAYDLPQEAAYEISETKPAPSWPTAGAIKFSNVSMAYRPGLPHVLKNLSFEVKPGQKIGICGRTGAGKSSIMTALYRLSELDKGEIKIDDVTIGKIGLKDLRSKLSIIPQDPVLFQGTLRKNLDPFGEQADHLLWDALRRSGLVESDQIERVKLQSPGDENLHKFHLDQMVEDEGANFSLGERQLMALARALVRNSKILILDEATSSVDYETDAKIQNTIVNEFGHCTILCIAHRLKTIIDYDKILVLEKGEIEEYDTPWALFNLEGGIFQSMCEKSNILEEDFQRKE